MSRSTRRPYDYICCFNHDNQSYAKNQHNRKLRRVKRDLLRELNSLEDCDDFSKPISLGTRKTEGLDNYSFPSDGGHIWYGYFKDSDFEFFRECYARMLRK